MNAYGVDQMIAPRRNNLRVLRPNNLKAKAQKEREYSPAGFHTTLLGNV